MADSGASRSAVPIRETNSVITIANRLDHFLARWGISRDRRRVEPGLYALGRPKHDSPVFVTANYRPSFDALRSGLSGIDCYIMSLDTKGINVWCAAGKGTFGTAELANRIGETGLEQIVSHRVLILPQLSAPGVSAHEVERLTGFNVEYGPVRSRDLKAYLREHKATPEMRRVRFLFLDRLVLVPAELKQMLVPMIVAAILLFLLGGAAAAAVPVAAVLAGTVLFPLLLPWLPTANFSTKGFALGAVASLPFVAYVLLGDTGMAAWQRAGWALSCLLAISSVTAFIALNFTGATTHTSKSGVTREIFAYVPLMAWMFGGSIALAIVLAVVRVFGVSEDGA